MPKTKPDPRRSAKDFECPKKRATKKGRVCKKSGPPLKHLNSTRVEKIASLGGTNEQIAQALDISEGTLFNIRKRDKAIDDAIKSGKDKADFLVVAALYQKAIGYQYTTGKGQYRKTVKIPGDTTAMIFWLKNRQPEKWREKMQVERSEAIYRIIYQEPEK